VKQHLFQDLVLRKKGKVALVDQCLCGQDVAEWDGYDRKLFVYCQGQFRVELEVKGVYVWKCQSLALGFFFGTSIPFTLMTLKRSICFSCSQEMRLPLVSFSKPTWYSFTSRWKWLIIAQYFTTPIKWPGIKTEAQSLKG
jgi:hypothetical protein